MQKAGKLFWIMLCTIAAIVIGILELPSKVHSFFEAFPTAREDIVAWWNLNTDYSGAWTDEGDITVVPENPVAMSMRVYGGKVDGEIWSSKLDNMIHPVILLGGDLRRGELDAYAYDFIDGKEVVFAAFKMKMDGGFLVVKTLDQAGQLFPKEARLFANPDALKDKARINFDLIQKYLKSPEFQKTIQSKPKP